jgi:hypothetical protein
MPWPYAITSCRQLTIARHREAISRSKFPTMVVQSVWSTDLITASGLTSGVLMQGSSSTRITTLTHFERRLRHGLPSWGSESNLYFLNHPKVCLGMCKKKDQFVKPSDSQSRSLSKRMCDITLIEWNVRKKETTRKLSNPLPIAIFSPPLLTHLPSPISYIPAS